MNTHIPPRLIDDMVNAYVEWREACQAIEEAYERWLSVRIAERESAFADYEAALDWEQHASAVYADCVNRVADRIPAVPAAVAAI